MAEILKPTLEERALELFLDKHRTPVQVIDILIDPIKTWAEKEVKSGKDSGDIEAIVKTLKDDVSEAVFKARSKAIDKRLIKKQGGI
jgi:hypothetical protein